MATPGITQRYLDEEMARMAARQAADIFTVDWGFGERPTSKPSGPDPQKVQAWLHKADQSVSWDSIIGNELAKTELREAIEAATINADLYSFYEMTPPKGVVFYGPPGCGKTMLAKAAVTALGSSEYILINGDELQSEYVGITERRIREIFAYAREYKKHHGKPLLIFIDEADAMLMARGSRNANWRNSQIAQFLSELDGLNEYGAFTILATNRPDSLDQALLRDGRIDRKIKIKRPAREAAETILRQSVGSGNFMRTQPDFGQIVDMLYSPDLLLQRLENPNTRAAHNFNFEHIINGAMITGLLARAKSLAFRRDLTSGTRSGVTTQDLLDAVMLVYEENKGLNHDYALREFIEDVALPAETLKNLN